MTVKVCMNVYIYSSCTKHVRACTRAQARTHRVNWWFTMPFIALVMNLDHYPLHESSMYITHSTPFIL